MSECVCVFCGTPSNTLLIESISTLYRSLLSESMRLSHKHKIDGKVVWVGACE